MYINLKIQYWDSSFNLVTSKKMTSDIFFFTFCPSSIATIIKKITSVVEVCISNQ